MYRNSSNLLEASENQTSNYSCVQSCVHVMFKQKSNVLRIVLSLDNTWYRLQQELALSPFIGRL